jgi:phosphosulfolactate phosphohydrolase-like enzyme
MRVDFAQPALLSDDEALDTAVVIDVLRATSTAAVLMHGGAPRIHVAATLDDLAQLPAGRHLIFSELSDVPNGHDRLDNSPTEARAVRLDGRVPVLVTTNGSRALCAAAARAREVIVASFLNVDAVVRYLEEAAPARVTMLPAGRFDRAELRAEDDACAQFIGARLRGEAPAFADAVAIVRGDALVQRRLAKEAKLARDVDLCLTLDGAPCVPRFSGAGGIGMIVV